MRPVLRGVFLFVVGAMLCAGVVFTADRGTAKGNLDRGTSPTLGAATIGNLDPVRHDRRVADITTADVYAYARLVLSHETTANALEGLERGAILIKQGQIDAAQVLLQKVLDSGALPEESRAEAYFLLGDTYVQGDGDAPLKGAAYIQEGLNHLDPDANPALYVQRRDLVNHINSAFGQPLLSADAIGGTTSGTVSLQNWRGVGTTEGARASATCADAVAAPVAPPFPYTETMSLGSGETKWNAYSLAFADGTSMRIETTNSSADTILDLFESDCSTLIDTNDDGGVGFLSLITTLCSPPGTYAVGVRGFFGFPQPDFDLEIAVIEECFVVGDDEFEPDPEISLATVIGCDPLECPDPPDTGGKKKDDDSDSGKKAPLPVDCPTTQTHTITPGDLDWVTFTVVDQPTRVVIETSGTDNTPFPNTLMALSDELGHFFAASRDQAIDDQTSRLELCLEPGQYNLAMTSSFVGDQFEYNISVTISDCACPFEAEPNAFCDLATPHACNSVVSGFIKGGGFTFGDEDWYTFTTTETLNITIETTNGGNTFTGDTFIQFWLGPCPGTFIAGDDDGGDGFFSRLSLIGVPADTWYIQIFDAFTGGGYAYNLEITCVVPPPIVNEVEPNDVCTAPNAVPVPSSVNGTIPSAGGDPLAVDFDYFTFSLTEDSNLSMVMFGFGDSVMFLLNAACTEAYGCDDDSGPGLLSAIGGFDNPNPCCVPAGDYTVELSPFSTFSDIGYSMEITTTPCTFGGGTPFCGSTGISCP